MEDQSFEQYPHLEKINVPADLRELPESDLKAVCDDVREYLIDTISKVGGHFGAGLGVVELTVALHYVFDTPKDKLVWDVGHQTYPHKILTGRKERLHTIRKKNGLAPFLRIDESEYDVFGAGHASTSISAALGIATARDFDDDNYKVVAIIGDGSMTGGMAYEALNNCGLLGKDIIVILNDNQMSIAPNVWSVHNYFNDVITSPTIRRLKDTIWEHSGDRIRTAGSKIVDGLKATFTPGMLFEALGFKYFGPTNGHNVKKLVEMLHFVKDQKGPVLLHVISEKGKGYAPAESHVQRYHAAGGAFDKMTGKAIAKPVTTPTPPDYTKVFGSALLEICKENSKVIGITAAMPDGTGLNILQKERPDRFFDVGIAEQHAVTFAAGMATQGYTPVCAIYSTFLQRAYDQIIHDVAIQNLNVIFAMDRGGLVGADGHTHHGMFDLSYMRLIPNMTIMAPKDEQELRDMLFTATEYRKGPIALRYPRGAGVGVPLAASGFNLLPIGQGEMLRDGSDMVIIGVGPILYDALKVADDLEHEGISVAVANARFIKPLDENLLEGLAHRFTHIVTLEENVVLGGFGSAVAEFYAGRGLHPKLKMIGLGDHFIEHGAPAELLKDEGLYREGIREAVKQFYIPETAKKAILG
ncbi:MAG TPA: 1-deoxy-D-xylulose-5-phosphate synthase [Candidatus Kapabacteria bacterium]|nr:1-deoxy-D-xylulose-5-phosphate synthase [Candidatus Kapabacteria bacterium]